MIMESLSLYLLIVSLFGSVTGHDPNSHLSGCQWNNIQFLNCKSTGITTLGDLFFLDHEIRNVTSPNHVEKYLKSTKYIDLSYNMMSALYLNVFYKFVSLETLNISNNQIYRVSIDKNGKQHAKGAFLASLQTLVLNRNRLVAIPKGLCKLKSLQTLSLSANRILNIQRDDFANCTALQHVDLGENRISSIHPDAFQDLRNLQVLKLHSNTLVSLSPLVFLFQHILKADIDLSENLWACDCNLQPLKYLISSLSTEVWKPWNVTCTTPFSKARQNILSIENSESCQTLDYSFIYYKTLLISAGEEAVFDCGSSNQLRSNDVLWWTPRGIVSKERQNSNYYLSNTNSLILDQPDISDKGLYICLTNVARIAYQLDIQANNLKSIRRSPRELQSRNTRMQTQYNFDLAVSLSVILTFLIAFFLGVFIRPYLENLWRKRCKSKKTEAQHADAAYDNEGFTADYTTRKHGVNSNKSSLPHHKTRQSNENPDEYKMENENISIQERAIDVQFPTYDSVPGLRKNIHELGDRLPKTKRVKWASDEDFNPNVNLKYLMSLIKPINFIALESSMPDMVHDHQSHFGYKDVTKMADDSYSSDEGSSFSLGSEYDMSDDDSIIKIVLQETKLGRQNNEDNVSLTINLKHLTSLLKPVHIIVPDPTVPLIVKSPTQKKMFPISLSTYPENRMKNEDNFPQNDKSINIAEGPLENSPGSMVKQKKNKGNAKTVYDTSSSDESSNFDSEYEHSDEDEMLNFTILGRKKSIKESNEISSPTMNLKYAMSLLKPINIIVPESSTTSILVHPKQRPSFPLAVSKYPGNRIEDFEDFPNYHDQEKRITNNQYKSHLHNKSSDTSSSDEESNISVNSDHYFSAEDAFIDAYLLKNQTRLANEILSPTVNLKNVISLIKPINITIPDSSTHKVILSYEHDKNNSIPVEKSEFQLQSTDLGNRYSDPKKTTEFNRPLYDSSSSEDSSGDDDDSPKAIIGSPILNNPLPTQRGNKENIFPTVNLRQVISTLKPIQIKVADESYYSDTIMGPNEDFKHTSQKLYYNSSSDEDSNASVDSDHDSSDAFVSSPLPMPVPPPRKSTASEKVYPTVNLKQIISSFKPIHINIPDSTHDLDALVTTKMHTQLMQNQYDFTSSESSSDSTDSEHEGSNEKIPMSSNISEPIQREGILYEDLTPMVNLKYIISSLKPVNIIVPDNIQYSDDLVSSDKSETRYDSSSSDEEFNDVIRSPSLPKPTLTEKANREDFYPTVNLRQVISTLKPIQIKVPDESYYSDTIMGPNEDFKHTSEKLYYYSSSDEDSNASVDSDHDSSDAFVSSPLPMPVPPPRKRRASEKVYPTVNLTQIISSFKPIHINITDSTHDLDTLVTPKKHTELMQNQYDFTSSESSSDSTDSEHEGSNEKIPMSSNISEPIQTEGKLYEHLTPMVNLKYIISSLKPVNIIVPDNTQYSDDLVSSDKSETRYDSSSSDEEFNDVIRSHSFPKPTLTEKANSEDVYPPVNLRQVISTLKPIQIKVPDLSYFSDTNISPKEDFEITSPKLYYYSSSDEDSNHSVDSDHDNSDAFVSSPLPVPPPRKRRASEKAYPSLNLSNIISSFKPIHINIPDSTQNVDTLVNPKKHTELMQNQYDFSSSGSSNDSTDSEHEESNEDVTMISNVSELMPTERQIYENSTLPVPPPRKRTASEKIYPSMNLKHIISSFKPIHINIPDSTHDLDTVVTPKKHTELMQNQYDLSSSESSSDSDSEHESFKEKVIQSINLPQQTELQNQDYSTSTVNLKHVISSLKPIHINVPDTIKYSGIVFQPNTEDNHELYDSTSSDESSDDYVDLKHEDLNEEVIHGSILPEQLTAERAHESLCSIVNLKHVIYSLKPIQIKIPDSAQYSDIPKKNTELTSPSMHAYSSFDESSDDSDDSKHDSSDEDVKRSPSLPILIPTTRESNMNVIPTVNLKSIMSFFKPLHITVSDTPVHSKNIEKVTQYPYYNILADEHSNDSSDSSHEGSDEEVIRSSTLPKPPMTTVITPKIYDSSSSDESSNAFVDSEHKNSYKHLVSLPMPKPMQIGQERNENVSPTVNLKHAISLLKPIQIKVPDTTHYSDALICPKENIMNTTQNLPDYGSSDESSNDSENESSDKDAQKSIDIPKQIPSTRANNPSSTVKTFPNHSDTSDSEGLEDVITSKPMTTKYAVNEKVQTVNLKNVISLLKPIHIKLPDSPNNSDSFIIPIKNVEVSKKLYNSSSSDESSAESGHEGVYEVTTNRMHINSSTDEDSSDSNDSKLEGSPEYILLTKHSTLPKPIPTEWTRNENHSPTVNFRYITSLIKPINIKVQDSAFHSEPLKAPKVNIEVTQEKYNSSSDSEHEAPYKFVNKQIPTESTRNKNAYPTVNLKHVTSVLKPIKIRLPDDDTPINPMQNVEVTSKTISDINLSNEQSNYFAISEPECSEEYLVRTTNLPKNKHDYPTVNLKHVTSLLKPIQIKVPDSVHHLDTFQSPTKMNKVTAEKHLDKSSSDESSKDSSDSEHDENVISSNLTKRSPRNWTNTEMVYPTENLRNASSLLQLESIKAQDSPVPEAVKKPKWKPFFLNGTSRNKGNKTDDNEKHEPVSHSKSQLYNKDYKHHHSYTFKTPSKNTNVILTSYKKMSSDNTPDNIDEWEHNEVSRADTISSDILKPKPTAQESEEDDALKVNLKHVMSLIKPVSINDPEISIKSPPPIIPRKPTTFQEQSSSSFHGRFPAQHSKVTKDFSQSDLINFYMDSGEEAALYSPPVTQAHDMQTSHAFHTRDASADGNTTTEFPRSAFNKTRPLPWLSARYPLEEDTEPKRDSRLTSAEAILQSNTTSEMQNLATLVDLNMNNNDSFQTLQVGARRRPFVLMDMDSLDDYGYYFPKS